MSRIIKQHYVIKAPITKVWQAFVDPKIIEEWGAGPAKMDSNVGMKFSLWGGDIYGTNTEVVPEKKLVQDWYGGPWSEPSRVTFKLTPKGESTEIDLTHTTLPDGEEDNFEEGWKDYYLGAIKELLEKK